MRTEYIDQDDVIKRFVQQIQNVVPTTSFFNTFSQHEVLQQKPVTYYSPYMVIAQRSGAGKTRLIFEVGRRALLVACLSGPFQSTHKITNYINDLRSAEPIEVAAFFVSVADFFLEKLREEVARLLGREVADDASIKSLSPEERNKIIMIMSRFFIPSTADDIEGVMKKSFEEVINNVSKWKSDCGLQKILSDFTSDRATSVKTYRLIGMIFFSDFLTFKNPFENLKIWDLAQL